MAVSIGKIGEFDAAVENWSSYLERLPVNHYFAANEMNKRTKERRFPLLYWKRHVWVATRINGS